MSDRNYTTGNNWSGDKTKRFDQNYNIRGTAWSVTVKQSLKNGEAFLPLIAGTVRRIGHQKDIPMLDVIGQEEIGPVEGRPHLQIFMETANIVSAPVVIKMLRDLLGVDSVFITAGSSQATAKMRAYACKYETRRPETSAWRWVRPEDDDVGGVSAAVKMSGDDSEALQAAAAQQNQRAERAPSQRATLIDGLGNGTMTLAQIQSKEPAQWAMWSRNFEAARRAWLLTRPIERSQKSVIVLWGKSGSGKTLSVDTFLEMHNLGPSDFFHVKASSNGRVWFDGYDGQKILVFDDFEGNIEVADFLHMTDFNAGSHLFEVKFGKVRLMHKLVLFTSNSNPDYWYSDEPMEKRVAAGRRITQRFRFGIDNVDVKDIAAKMSIHILTENPDAFLDLKMVKDPQWGIEAPWVRRKRPVQNIISRVDLTGSDDDEEEEEDVKIEPTVKRAVPAIKREPTVKLEPLPRAESPAPTARKGPPSIKLERAEATARARDGARVALQKEPVPWLNDEAYTDEDEDSEDDGEYEIRESYL